MVVDYVQAIFEIVYQHLTNANPLWNDRVRPVEMVDAELAKPYIAFFYVSEIPESSHPSREIYTVTLTIKGVAGGEGEQDALGTALAIRRAISELFKDSGATDYNPRLPTHSQWAIQNVTQGRPVWIPEQVADSLPVYHAGYQFDFLIERK